MTSLDRIAGWFALLMFLVASASWFARDTSRPSVLQREPDPYTTSLIDSWPDLYTPGDGMAEPGVDLNGNEIDNAVGDYRVDERGNVFETHAPQTAVAILPPPRS
jgi:hypothetical protein